jgi:hypothetical protein
MHIAWLKNPNNGVERQKSAFSDNDMYRYTQLGLKIDIDKVTLYFYFKDDDEPVRQRGNISKPGKKLTCPRANFVADVSWFTALVNMVRLQCILACALSECLYRVWEYISGLFLLFFSNRGRKF